MIEKYGYLYKTQHPTTGYYYIGQHIGSTVSRKYRGSGKQLKAMFKEHRKSEWELTVLEWVSNQEELDAAEKKHVGTLWRDDPYCLNMRQGGGSPGKLKESAKQHISEAFHKWFKPGVSFNYPHIVSEKGKQHLSEIHKGALNPMYGKFGGDSPSAKQVRCVELDRVFPSLVDAEVATGVAKQNISKVCRGIRPRAGGYRWEFVS